MAKKSGDIRGDILWRIGLLYILMIVFAVAIIARVVYIQVAEGDSLKEKASSYALKNITIEPNRGDICAVDGRVLSSSVPFYELRMDLGSDALDQESFSNNIDSLSLCLSKLFGDKSQQAYKRDLLDAKAKNSRYFLIKRNVTFLQLKEAKKFPIFRLGKFKGGLIVIQDNKRMKPFLNLASRTIGYLSKDESAPKVGLEGAYDRQLRGVQGVKLMQKLSGNDWKPVNDGNEVEPVDGNTLITTIDINFQDVAENALMKHLKSHEADHGCAILMEVETGEIMAMANLTRTSDGEYVESYNYAIGESTEPGSTFKLASLIVALDDGYIDIDDSVETGKGIVYYYDLPVRDTKTHGKLSVQEAFEVSSNVGISKIITANYGSNPVKFVDKLYAMGLNEKLGLEIRGEGKPLIKYPGDSMWSGVTLPQMSIGYEVKLTPLQILTFYNAIANDGKMVKPRFVRYLRQHGDTIKIFPTEIIKPLICTGSTIKKVKLLLEGVVERGTAKNLSNTVYKIAGKTGTAQIAKSKAGYGAIKSYQASFVGYFPADNPKYSCIVVVNAPSNEVYYGNLVAGPIFKEIADKVYSTSLEIHESLDPRGTFADVPVCMDGYYPDIKTVLMNIKINHDDFSGKNKWVNTFCHDSIIEIRGRAVGSGLIPNVKG
ncbi:MAG: penicillin-binding protein 2, partial [Bacteroidota bacterium]